MKYVPQVLTLTEFFIYSKGECFRYVIENLLTSQMYFPNICCKVN